MTKLIDLTGMRFGTWLVLARSENRNGTPHWECVCDCGEKRVVYGHGLRRGMSTNCGCLRKHYTKHGHARREQRGRVYGQWKAMHARCSPTNANLRNYGARGITVCDRWSDYELFYSDMGECPAGMSLDRIDNDAGYSPGNCRWADKTTQRRNQRRVSWVSFSGRTMTVQDAAHEMGLHPASIWNDLRRKGGTIQEATDRVAARRNK